MRTTRVALVVLTGLSLCACGGDKEPTKTYTIAAMVGLTGNNADIAYGESVQLGIDQLNEALSKEKADFRFNLVLNDSQAIPATAMAQGLDAVQNHGAKLVVFDTSQDVVVAAQSYYDADTSNDLGVVLMDGLGSGASIMKPTGAPWQVDADNWIWRTVMSSTPCAYQAIDSLSVVKATPENKALGDFNGDGVVKISMFGTNDGLGQPLVADASTRAKQVFGNSVVIETAFHEPGLSVDAPDWATFVTKLLDANDDLASGTVAGTEPDMIFAGLQVLYNVPTYKAYLATGKSQIPFMGSLAMRSGVFLNEVGAQAEGAQAVGFLGVAPNDSGQRFQDDFQAANGVAGGTAGLYDATVISGLAAIIAAHATGDIDTVGNDDIKAALPQTSTKGGVRVPAGVDGLRAAIRAVNAGQSFDYDGASGPDDFDQYGGVRSYLSLNKVESLNWVNAEIYDCTGSSDTCPILQ